MKKEILKWLPLMICIIVLYVWSHSGKANWKFIDATVTSEFRYKSTSRGAGYDYVFYLNGKKYSRVESQGNFWTGYKYLAAYDSLDPESGTLLQINITDFKFSSPRNGWKLKEIPFPVDSLQIKKMLE
ncbi:hypothetical protein SAMN05660477_02845 [Soonwooa buanensis]|uniref:Uncharacterized protein n=1 Tax=Soonwooa buanensis TaxID=619805 RepID=A0A1T5GHL4_9FLAO|nr:hypothetical protein [Soonwooa buanensis]SKC07944.1 hypothetical protein SAMN05660477_02845 [Soonwooa buanensis]